MSPPRIFLTVLSTLLLLSPPGAGQEIKLKSTRTRFRTSAEFLGVPGEDIGLLGVHYDWLEPFEEWSDLYLGVGGYVSVLGGRGGFRSAGFSAGYAKEFVPDFMIDAGVFFGGAGGSGALGEHQGLAVRAHVGLERAFGVFGVRIEAAAMDVAETDIEIEDIHLSIGLTSASELLLASEHYLDDSLADNALVERTIRTSVRYARLRPGSGARTRSGDPYRPDIHLVGLGIDYFLGEHLFLPLQAYGAVGGEVAGFSAALLGLGGSYPLDREGRLRLEGSLSLGAGGGGGLDTGGGFLWQTKAALQAVLTRNIGLELAAGHFDFPDGHLDGAEYSASLTWTVQPFELALDQPRSNLQTQGVSDDDVDLRPVRVFALNKIYMPPRSATLSSGGSISTANLIGIGLEQPIYDDFSLTASTCTAWDGSIGGYTEGLVGVAYEYVVPENEKHSFLIRGEAGAAGGGGVDVGSGLVYSLTAGYRYHMSERLFFQAEIGKLEADRGSFEAETWQLGIGVDLGRPYAR